MTIVAFICSSFIQIEWQKFKSKYGFLCVVKTIHIWLFRCDTYLIYARSDVTSIISYYNQDWNIQIYASYIIVWSIKSKTIIIAPQKWGFFLITGHVSIQLASQFPNYIYSILPNLGIVVLVTIKKNPLLKTKSYLLLAGYSFPSFCHNCYPGLVTFAPTIRGWWGPYLPWNPLLLRDVIQTCK